MGHHLKQEKTKDGIKDQRENTVRHSLRASSLNILKKFNGNMPTLHSDN